MIGLFTWNGSHRTGKGKLEDQASDSGFWILRVFVLADLVY